jgi:hypothetical protein
MQEHTEQTLMVLSLQLENLLVQAFLQKDRIQDSFK